MDRSDRQFAAKVLCRWMAKPRTQGLGQGLKNREVPEISTPRSLGVRARAAQRKVGRLRRQRLGKREASMKSTSGGALKRGGSTLKSWSSSLTTIASSSAEAELHAISKCAQQTASWKSIARDFGKKVQFSSSQRCYCRSRRGLGGKTRHVKVQYLWLLDAVENKELWRTLELGESLDFGRPPLIW